MWISGWWFGTWILFSHEFGNNHPNWRLIFFRGVETTNLIFFLWLDELQRHGMHRGIPGASAIEVMASAFQLQKYLGVRFHSFFWVNHLSGIFNYNCGAYIPTYSHLRGFYHSFFRLYPVINPTPPPNKGNHPGNCPCPLGILMKNARILSLAT